LFLIFPGEKWLGQEVNHSPQTSTGVKKERSYISAHAACLQGKDRETLLLPSFLTILKEITTVLVSESNRISDKLILICKLAAIYATSTCENCFQKVDITRIRAHMHLKSMANRRALLPHTSNSDLKYGLQADKTILCALHVCPSHASVTSVKLFSSRRCLNDETILDWKSFHFKKNCCCSADMVLTEQNKSKLYHAKYNQTTHQKPECDLPCEYKIRANKTEHTHIFSQTRVSRNQIILKPPPLKKIINKNTHSIKHLHNVYNNVPGILFNFLLILVDKLPTKDIRHRIYSKQRIRFMILFSAALTHSYTVTSVM